MRGGGGAFVRKGRGRAVPEPLPRRLEGVACVRRLGAAVAREGVGLREPHAQPGEVRVDLDLAVDVLRLGGRVDHDLGQRLEVAALEADHELLHLVAQRLGYHRAAVAVHQLRLAVLRVHADGARPARHRGEVPAAVERGDRAVNGIDQLAVRARAARGAHRHRREVAAGVRYEPRIRRHRADRAGAVARASAADIAANRSRSSHSYSARFSPPSRRRAARPRPAPPRPRGAARFINATAAHFLSLGLPAISVDAKKKELVGNFKNAGRDYRPKGNPEKVEVYDFVTEQGRATPYGVYDIARNEGYVNVGISHDTAEFAVDSIRKWWRACGEKKYAGAGRLLVMADGGGSNGSRNRLWKVEFQKLSNELGIEIYVCHFPLGTSKWNKIEHRLFSHISMIWRGRPLTSLQVIVNLIGSTTSKTGLKVVASSTRKSYKTGSGSPTRRSRD